MLSGSHARRRKSLLFHADRNLKASNFYYYFMHMGNLPAYMTVYHMDAGCLRGQKRVSELLEPESQTVVSHCMGVGI